MHAILLVDHGSRREGANAQLIAMTQMVQDLRGDVLVGYAHLEIVTPDIAQGFANLVARGARHIILVPYFLSPGRHVSEDIPRLAMAAQAPHAASGITHVVVPALGPDVLLARLVLLRAGFATPDPW